VGKGYGKVNIPANTVHMCGKMMPVVTIPVVTIQGMGVDKGKWWRG
jgi:hypothetical protein